MKTVSRTWWAPFLPTGLFFLILITTFVVRAEHISGPSTSLRLEDTLEFYRNSSDRDGIIRVASDIALSANTARTDSMHLHHSAKYITEICQIAQLREHEDILDICQNSVLVTYLALRRIGFTSAALKKAILELTNIAIATSNPTTQITVNCLNQYSHLASSTQRRIVEIFKNPKVPSEFKIMRSQEETTIKINLGRHPQYEPDLNQYYITKGTNESARTYVDRMYSFIGAFINASADEKIKDKIKIEESTLKELKKVHRDLANFLINNQPQFQRGFILLQSSDKVKNLYEHCMEKYSPMPAEILDDNPDFHIEIDHPAIVERQNDLSIPK